jgi:hypothetical protein
MHHKYCGMRLYPSRLLETVVPDVTRDVTALFLAIMDGVSHIHVVSFSAWQVSTKSDTVGRAVRKRTGLPQDLICLLLHKYITYKPFKTRSCCLLQLRVTASSTEFRHCHVCSCVDGKATNTQLTFLSTSLQTVATLKNVAKNVRLRVCSTPSAQKKVTRWTTYASPPKFSLLRLITQKHVNFGI